MFTPRSANARQTFPRVPGRSSKRMANSLLLGMVLHLLDESSGAHGCVPGQIQRPLRSGFDYRKHSTLFSSATQVQTNSCAPRPRLLGRARNLGGLFFEAQAGVNGDLGTCWGPRLGARGQPTVRPPKTILPVHGKILAERGAFVWTSPSSWP